MRATSETYIHDAFGTRKILKSLAGERDKCIYPHKELLSQVHFFKIYSCSSLAIYQLPSITIQLLLKIKGCPAQKASTPLLYGVEREFLIVLSLGAKPPELKFLTTLLNSSSQIYPIKWQQKFFYSLKIVLFIRERE